MKSNILFSIGGIATALVISALLLGRPSFEKKSELGLVSERSEEIEKRISPTPISTPVPTPIIGKPVSIYIPRLEINSLVETVGLDEKQRMDVPKNPENVAWYELGPKPGENGSSVIAGHLDSSTGPAVFYRLELLENGDLIEIEDEFGENYKFRVVGKNVYEDESFPLQEVFSNNDGKKLNLITCQGKFDRNARNYSHRLVVFTELVE
jgi:LPXTG-site transpeptidase (sortase) family protein